MKPITIGGLEYPVPKPQSAQNHRQRVPLFLAVAGFFLIDFLWAAWRLYRVPDVDHVMRFLLPAALIVLAFQARAFSLRVHDRVIRLEMRLRLQTLLPPE